MIRNILHATAVVAAFCGASLAQSGVELRLRADADLKTARGVTGGMLLRVDQKTRQLVPELAASWEVDTHERWIRFHLRPDVKAEDVVAAMVRLMDPKLNAGAGHPFRARTWPPRIDLAAPDTVLISFDAPVPGLLRLFAQVSILRGDV